MDHDALSHLDEQGRVKMVDVGGKEVTARVARAWGEVKMAPETLALITAAAFAKGDVLAVARVAGIMAAKQTGNLIPLCHPLPLEKVAVELIPVAARHSVVILAEARVSGRTGVEMEAMTAVSLAALTIYDMCKAVDRGMAIAAVTLLEKRGGRSGHFINPAYGVSCQVPAASLELEAGRELVFHSRWQDGRQHYSLESPAAAGEPLVVAVGAAAGDRARPENRLVLGPASVCLLGEAVLLPAGEDGRDCRGTRMEVFRGGRVAAGDLLAVL